MLAASSRRAGIRERRRLVSNAIANLLADSRRRSASARTRSCFYSSCIFFSTRLGSPLLFSSGPAVIIRHVTVIFFFDVFIEFCVERAFRSEKCSFCVRSGVCVSSDVDVADWKWVMEFYFRFHSCCFCSRALCLVITMICELFSCKF